MRRPASTIPTAFVRYVACGVGVLWLATAHASDEQREFFESRIRPVLVQHCYECHNSSGTAEGELILDHRDGLRAGGAGGPVIVAGDPANSRLPVILRHEIPGLEMPSGGPKLDESVVRDFESWIRDGAFDPRDRPPSAEELMAATSWEARFEQRRQWWSFQPIRDVTPPDNGDQMFDHPVDRFIAAAQQQHGLAMNAPADATALIRRLYFALTGLPPNSRELAHWESALDVAEGTSRYEATERLIDHLLASPQFGERWARHWMDWIRYAESHGSEGDPVIDNAWQYRDYLIRALNDDVAVSQLLREHVAGDLLESPRINPALQINESAIGPAHWRMVFHGFAPTDALDERVRFVDDQVSTFTRAFLGLTVSCARCHDHKFDAISQADYYALFGVLSSCRPARTVIDASNETPQIRARLRELRQKIRLEIARAWTTQLGGDATFTPGESTPGNNDLTQHRESAAPAGRLDLRSWYVYGAGVADGVQPAGDFVVALDGDRVVDQILPAGICSRRISSKDPARATSPDLLLDQKYDLWLHAMGDGGAAARYVVQNYPRNGTVYPVHRLKPDWEWIRFDLSYWTGDTIHIELVAGKDAPLLVDNQDRSWFAIDDVRLLPAGSPAPNDADDPVEAETAQVRDAVEAFASGQLSDLQADVIRTSLKAGVLDNRISAFPKVGALVNAWRQEEARLPVPVRVPGLDETVARDQPLFVRGDHRQPADAVPRRFLSAIDPTPYPRGESGRRQLADDLLRDDNPFTRRVMVNRVWHHLFGRGLVATPDNFGQMGERPTHPELLDWLATRFVSDGWSLKKLIRLMVTSRTWQQSSQPSSAARERDPDNHWLSHANVRRLEAEAIRDLLLAVSGQLQSDMFGPPLDVNANRRSIYVRVIRNDLPPFLRTFDFPEPFSAVGRRSVTNVPAQSLTMLNDPRVGELAGRWIERTVADPDLASDAERIRSLYVEAFSRPPVDSEVAEAILFLNDARQQRTDMSTQRRRMAEELERLRERHGALRNTVRAGLPQAIAATPLPGSEGAMAARWSFDDSAEDDLNHTKVTLHGGARIEDGALVVDGKGSWAVSPLPDITLTEKSLEAWVQLDHLDQRGGGVISVQSPDGVQFDAIVFAEQAAGQWLAGSDNFRRTQPFGGAADTEAADTAVHLVISWDAAGNITGYRNGEAYGQPYRSDGPATFPGQSSVVTFGLRHLPAVGNRFLAGRILEARLYRRALTADEVRESAKSLPGFVTESQLLNAMSDAQRIAHQHLEEAIRTAEQHLHETIAPGTGDPERDAWTDLARSLFCFKEFIYIR